MMEREFEILKVTRQNMLNIVNSLSSEQLVKIPSGFKNNILWNVGHCVSASQGLCYGISGLPLMISDEFRNMFKKGSGPSEWTTSPDIENIKEILITSVDTLEEDYKKGVFKKYGEYPTSYGYTLKSIEDAISFNNVHEGLHLGVIMSLKKFV
jgi:hypothetical protein